MTVDIRAKVYCDLGEVISGGFSDDHAQGTGLIRTRGELVLSGIVRPGLGRRVQLGWKKGTQFSRIPRELRVISFFADPFRRITTIQLGCSLTLLENLKPANERDRFFYSKEDDDNKDLECRVYDIGLLPIKSVFIAQRCLNRLGISGTPNLTNYYAKDRFDLSAGYVSVLNDLLYAEGKIGFMLPNGQLQVVDGLGGTSSAVISEEDVIDIGPINSGEPPVDSIKVRYNYARYKEPDVTVTEEQQRQARWELDEQVSEIQTKIIKYAEDLGIYQQVVIFQPRQVTVNLYDKFDRLLESTTTETTNVADVNPSYIKSIRTGQKIYALTTPPIRIDDPYLGSVKSVTRVLYDYERAAGILQDEPPETTAEECLEQELANPFIFDPDKDSRPIRTRTYKYVTDMHVAAALNIEDYYYIDETNNAQVYQPSTELDVSDGIYVLEEETVEEYVNKDTTAKIVEYTLAGGSITTYVPAVANKTVTKRKVAEYKTIKCQQQFAVESEFYETAAELEEFVNSAKRLTDAKTSVQVQTAPSVSVPKRPSATEAADIENRKVSRPAEDLDGLELVYGSDVSSNARIFDLPLAPDDRIRYTGGGYPGTWSVIPSDVRQKALRFGRVQQRLAFGYRYGFSIQLAAGTMPPYPLGGLIVNSAGAYGSFLCNGTSWSFDSNGIVCNTDAIYRGAVGASSGSYTIWFQIQPGVTLLPSVTPSTNPTPAPVNNVDVPADFNPNDSAPSLDWGLITGSVGTSSDWGSILAAPSVFDDWEADDQWGIVPYNEDPVPASYIDNPALIPPYTENVDLVYPVYMEAVVTRIDPQDLEVPLEMAVRILGIVPEIKPEITTAVIIEATVDTTFFDYTLTVHIEADVTATFEEAEGMLFGYVLV
jgi:hypothetical protein